MAKETSPIHTLTSAIINLYNNAFSLQYHSFKLRDERMPKDDEDLSETAFLKKELEATLVRVSLLEKENQELRHEVGRLKAQVGSLRAQESERKSMLWKKLQNSISSNDTDASQQKPTVVVKISEEKLEADAKPEFGKSEGTKDRPARVPRLPPKSSLTTLPSLKEVDGKKVPSAPAPPPPPPPSPRLLPGSRAVRRVPEVMEFYRSLTRRDARTENKTNPIGIQAVKFSKSMIGEIENRSTYLSAIKSDVETQGEFINFLAREVATAAHKEISDVEAFVKWLDEELSYLVDERAVLKHFPQWPERKADALREAAFSYRDLKNLDTEVSSFKDDRKQPLTQALKKMQALQDRLEQSVNNIERIRDSSIKRYKESQIPWDWMLDTGVIGQLKLSSIKIARQYMKRIASDLKSNECSQETDLMLQGVRFAYRVHQFAGGFDADTTQAFEELKNIGTSCRK